jgi:hypothetical protein
MSEPLKIRAEVTAIEMLDPVALGAPRCSGVTVQAVSPHDQTCLSFETQTRPEIDAPVSIVVTIGTAPGA